MVRYEGRMRYVEDIKNFQKIMKNRNRKEEEASNSHEPILEAVFDPRVRSNNKDMNTVIKIIQYLRKIGCSFEKIKNNGFRARQKLLSSILRMRINV